MIIRNRRDYPYKQLGMIRSWKKTSNIPQNNLLVNTTHKSGGK